MTCRIRARLVALLSVSLAMTPGAMTTAEATHASARYVSSATAVARANSEPVVDEGSVVCDGGDGVGVGGACLPFVAGENAIEVLDATGREVAYQVCLDNDGDGFCTSPDTGSCPDQVFFSHDDRDQFYNPLGPLPTGFRQECPGGRWNGYVVFLCEGVHFTTNAHTHEATTGIARVTTGGEGLGTFCGGSAPAPSRKPYFVEPRRAEGPDGYGCGFTAVTDPNPEADANDMTGEIDAGPATTDVPGTMVCTIQVNSNTHSGPDAVSRSFPSDANGVIAGVQAATYSTAEDAQDYLCTSFVSASGTVYWDGNSWELSASVECSAATQGGTQDLVDIIDGALCPALADEHPGTPPSGPTYIDYEGDVFVDVDNDGIHENAPDSSDAMADLFFDCPVYTFTINDDSNPDQLHDAVTGLLATNKVIDH